MSKILLWVIVGAIVGFGGYSIIKNKAEVKDLNQDAVMNRDETENDTSTKKMAFSEFVKQDGGSYKCEVKQALSDMENNGTVYIDSGKISGEHTTVAEGRTITSYFIIREGYSYMWYSDIPNGVKVKNADAETTGTYTWKAEQIGDYNCEAWVANESQFSVPSAVTFTEIKSS